MYRHALPPGFVLKKDKKKEEKEEEISLEELIENEVRMDALTVGSSEIRVPSWRSMENWIRTNVYGAGVVYINSLM